MHAATPNRSPLGRLLLTDRRAQLAELIAVFAIPGIIFLALQPLFADKPTAATALIWLAYLSAFALIIIGLRLRGQGLADLGLPLRFAGRRAAIRTFLQSLAIAVAAVIAFLAAGYAAQGLLPATEPLDTTQYDNLRDNLPAMILSLLGIYVVSSFGEEFVFRGFLVTRLAQLFGATRAADAAAVLLSAVIFGLIHFAWGPIGQIQTAATGLAFGAGYIATRRNLWATVLAHAYMDTLLIVSLYFAPAQS